MKGFKGVRKRIYLSGAITGTTDYMERFEKAQKKLEKLGYSVLNPALVCSNMPQDATYEEYMQISFCMLDMCDTICMLPGHEQSNGARLELERARANHIEVLLYDSL